MKMIMILNFLKFYMFIILLILCMSLLLLCMSIKNMHPLMLGLILFIYSILVSLNMNLFNKSSIYSMLMFLIIIGGFLILFLYFNSFAINNKLIFNMNIFMKFSINLMMTLIIFFFMIYKNGLFNMILFLSDNLLETKIIYKNINSLNNNNINLFYLKYNKLTLFCLIYLLMSLIISMKIIFYVNPKFMRQLKN